MPPPEALALPQLYRAMVWLGEPLDKTAADASGYGLRSRKDVIEEALFARRRELFTQLDLVFFDATSAMTRRK